MTTETKIIIGVVIATVIILGGGIWFLNIQGAKDQAKLNQPLIGEAIASQGANHVPESTKEEYSTNPPTSGPHYANSQPAGIYDKPIPDGNLIHSMEHGAVVVWYRADLPQGEVEQIRAAFDAAKVGKKIMTPRAGLDVPVALTSWGYLLKLDAIDAEKITEFILANNDRGPEKAPI